MRRASHFHPEYICNSTSGQCQPLLFNHPPQLSQEKKKEILSLFIHFFTYSSSGVFFVCLFFTLGRHVVIYIKHDLLQFVSCQKSPIIPPVLWLPESYN